MFVGASIALIYMIILALIAALGVLAVCVGMIFLLAKLRGVMKRVLPKGQVISYQVANTAHIVSDKVAAPFIKANGLAVEARTVVAGARQRLRRT